MNVIAGLPSAFEGVIQQDFLFSIYSGSHGNMSVL
jgi:hypothetical protein